MCMGVLLVYHMHACPVRPQEAITSPGAEPEYFGRAASALNLWAISTVLVLHFKLKLQNCALVFGFFVVALLT